LRVERRIRAGALAGAGGVVAGYRGAGTVFGRRHARADRAIIMDTDAHADGVTRQEEHRNGPPENIPAARSSCLPEVDGVADSNDRALRLVSAIGAVEPAHAVLEKLQRLRHAPVGFLALQEA